MLVASVGVQRLPPGHREVMRAVVPTLGQEADEPEAAQACDRAGVAPVLRRDREAHAAGDGLGPLVEEEAALRRRLRERLREARRVEQAIVIELGRGGELEAEPAVAGGERQLAQRPGRDMLCLPYGPERANERSERSTVLRLLS